MSSTLAMLTIEGVDAEIHVHGGTITEAIGAALLAELTVSGVADGEPALLGPLDPVGHAATLTLHLDGKDRVYALRVDAVEDLSGQSSLRLVSPVAWLADTCDYRVFVDQSATDIVTTVLGEHDLRLDLRARRAAPKRAHCVQHFESDVDFCARLFAEEGMSWFPQADDAGVICVSDAPETYPDPGLSLPFHEEAGLMLGQAVHGLRLKKQVTVEKSTLRDHDFEAPMLDLHGEAGKGALERYEFPGGFVDPGAGKELAAIRLAQQQGEAVVLEGLASCPELAAGHYLSLSDAPEGLPDEPWLLLRVVHRIEATASAGELRYEARFRAVPKSAGYRSPRPAQARRGGAGNAVVTGAAGQEIALDAHGRTRVRMRWDRRNAADESSSGYARVTQPQLGGAMMNPRVGWEELVGYSERGAEIPVLLGRVYNAVQAPPTSLPGRKVESHFGTMTTPGGSSGNFLQISDTAGSEGFALNATGNYEERTENDKVTKIAATQQRDISGARTLNVLERLSESVAGAQTLTVGALRKVTVGSNYGVVAGSEQVIVGGARMSRVGGDYLTKTPTFVRVVGGVKQEIPIEHQSVFTQGVSNLLVGGSLSTKTGVAEAVGVAGAAVIKVSGLQAINAATYALTVRGLYLESYGSRTATSKSRLGESCGKVTYDITGAATYTGSSVVIEAGAMLTIKASGLTITMTPGSITVQGNYQVSGSSVEDGVHRYG
jgi:type VI secretion system secreted protein VgrG